MRGSGGIRGGVARRLGASLALALLTTTAFGSATAATADAPKTTDVVQISPTSGPPGTSVDTQGRGFVIMGYCHGVQISFTDANGRTTTIGGASLNRHGSFRTTVTIPTDAASGSGTILVKAVVLQGRLCVVPLFGGEAVTFTVTP
jgi:hypothetical protein